MEFFRKQKVGNVVVSLVLITIGALLLFYPEQTKEIACYCLGGILVLVGLLKVLSFFITKKPFRDSDTIGEAIAWFILGLVLVLQWKTLIDMYHIIVGLVIVVKNSFKLSECISYKKAGFNKLWFDLVLILIMLGCGITLCVLPPGDSKFLGYFTPAVMIVDGIITVLLLFVLENVKRSKKKMEEMLARGENPSQAPIKSEPKEEKVEKNDVKEAPLNPNDFRGKRKGIGQNNGIVEQEVIDVIVEDETKK